MIAFFAAGGIITFLENPAQNLRKIKACLLMHPATSELLETILIVLRDQGEDAAFDYVRREVLGKK